MPRLLSPSRLFLREQPDLPTEEEEARFFSSLQMSDGTTKMTQSRRLTDVNAALAAQLGPRATLALLDAGVSSGISSVEWIESLEALGTRCELTAFDRVLGGRLYRAGSCEVLTEAKGHALLFATGARTIFRPTRATAGWRNRLVRAFFHLLDGLAAALRAARLGRDVHLVSSRVLARPDIRLAERDLFAPAPSWRDRFDVVRVANLLNRSYFSDSLLQAGLANLSEWVREGGFLVVARTESDGTNNGTIFRRTGGRLVVVSRIGSGSEVEPLVAQGTR